MNEPAATPDSSAAPAERRAPQVWIAIAVLTTACVAAIAYGWQTQRRVHEIEQELVRRQSDAQAQAAQAQLAAKQAEEAVRETAAKQALLEARLSEVAVQRGQIENLIQTLSHSRDENLLVDIDAGLRLAMQQAALTGSAEPLVSALRLADERLARHSQPRLEVVRRAIARDLDRVKTQGVVDLGALTIKIDEAVRMVDEMPLLSQPEPRRDPAAARAAKASASAAKAAARKASAPEQTVDGLPEWLKPWMARWDALSERVWDEAKSLVRVTRIEQPEAMLIAPEQAYFLRENLKLRLLNARLALLARQFDTAQSDLQSALAAIERYFDRSARRTQLTAELIRQVAAQAGKVGVPRPDATLAALTAAAAGR